MTTPSSSLPPANWYPDPQTPGQLRYWDGQRWTVHIHPLQQPTQPAPGSATVVQSVPSLAPVAAQEPRVFVPTTSPGLAVGGAGVSAGAVGISPAGPVLSPGGAGLRAPTPKPLDDDVLGSEAGRVPQAVVASVLGLAALGAALLAVFDAVPSVDSYLPYAGALLGFLAIFLGLIGRRKAVGGVFKGTAASWFGIGAGFFALAISAYEYRYPGEILGIIQDFLGSAVVAP